ncbi:uncharacterized protein EDB93DRAFT_1104495 [Suillus bovinus]|uniref:uncharacterized protein n=1 Tax=Suillus bovinus TaxID=48563 RepID=UPI001B88576E|nr:uncharacterized protein EDB93DRAFT_1104495 [Suillus bovinus]KAG2146106.1 hypothetical protein EDB93DRAFT_1104495 [Suillus bovinus]
MTSYEHLEIQYPWSQYAPPISVHAGSLPRSLSPWSDDTPFVEREQTICSDFTCCGLSLRDLHSLVDHFEEAHVVVFDNAGNAVYPNPSPILRVLDHENEGPYKSFVLGYPAPKAPVAFLDPEFCFESASDRSSPSGSSESISPVETSSEECLSQNSFTKVKSKPVRTGKRVHRPGQRKKDKTYNCPARRIQEKKSTLMAKQTYLNANGLKYHLEKGTCKNEMPMPEFYR